MGATTTKLAVTELLPGGLINNDGYKLGYVDGGTKGAQHDLWEITNASIVKLAWLTLDATGAAEPYTVSGASITLTGGTGTDCSGLILYKE